MAEPYLGEIRLFANNFAPQGWVKCEGQILSIQQNTALFALLGTTYGGNGTTTFALPDLRGRVPIHFDSNFPLGEMQGEENHTLTVNEMPAHNHMVQASNASSATKPTSNLWGNLSAENQYGPAATLTPMNQGSVSTAGGSQPHTNMQPLLSLNFCIAIAGIFPPRN